MTIVYVTRTGSKYHASSECASFNDVEREHGRTIERWPEQLEGQTTLEPCAVCWSLEQGYDQWRQLSHRVERDGDSPYEALFVEMVLRNIRGLTPSDVTTQRKARGRSGDIYFLDFVVEPRGGHRVAVEIDGADKAPGIKSPGRSDETWGQSDRISWRRAGRYLTSTTSAWRIGRPNALPNCAPRWPRP